MAKKAANAERKKTGGKGKQWEALAKELEGLIPQLNSEGLAFLAEQAKVHLYNMRVDELNKAAAEANEAENRAKSSPRADSSPRGGSVRGKAKAADNGFTIRGTESGSSFYLHYGNDDIMFSRDEMTRLVKIVNGEGNSLEIRERLYNWFDRERRDIFSVVPIADKFDERLKALSALIKKSFAIRGK